jgi:macrolide-specific efflux system membrane fusion protein
MIPQAFLSLLTIITLTMASPDVKSQESTPEAAAPVSSGDIEIADAQVSLIQNTFIAAPIAGFAARVLVAEGDRVEQGRELVRFDSEQVEMELEAARAAYDAACLESDNDVNVRYAKRTMEVHQQELKQSMDANRKFTGSVSESEIAKQQLVVDQARLAIEQAEHELQIALAKAREKLASAQIVEALLRKHGVRSTVSGLVVEVAVEPGEWMEAGSPIVRIISLDPIRVECFIDGTKYGPELVGRSIEFRPNAAGAAAVAEATEPLLGEVTFVSPELHPITGQSRLWATIKNPKLTVRAGMRGRMVIHADSATERQAD